MDPFTSHTGIVATIDRANIDTDQIMPKQFLKSIHRVGFGEHAFSDWRYLPDGSLNLDFILNQPPCDKATILVARNNFGCGSSREHAVWGITQFGFRVVIAPRALDGDTVIPAFADIFRNNSGKNGLLTIELSEEEVEQIFQAAAAQPGIEMTVDLEAQTLTLHKKEGDARMAFDIDAGLKDKLVKGLDDIALTLQSEEEIATFEATHSPQLYGCTTNREI
ncbi:MAG: 3-isopropylmalate dehydratase small subunit [Spartobacteria bacterium]|nr:3-isopropylmalate dehydratase small subunit [Spartobacteria bacterium]